MPKAKITEDAAVERAIDEALAAGKRVVFEGLDPSASGHIGFGEVVVDRTAESRRVDLHEFEVRRGGRIYVAHYTTANSEPAPRDPWGYAGLVLGRYADPRLGSLVIITCEEQYIGPGISSAMKVLEARVRMLYAFERHGRKLPHIMLTANPMTWHSRVLGSKRWTNEEVKPAAARYASAVGHTPIAGDAADALCIAVHQLSRFFTFDLGRFRS
jgi:hypothetical protein